MRGDPDRKEKEEREPSDKRGYAPFSVAYLMAFCSKWDHRGFLCRHSGYARLHMTGDPKNKIDRNRKNNNKEKI